MYLCKKIDVFMYKFYVFTYKFYVFMYFMWKLARMKDSCCACKRVISFILMGHVTHEDASRRTFII